MKDNLNAGSDAIKTIDEIAVLLTSANEKLLVVGNGIHIVHDISDRIDHTLKCVVGCTNAVDALGKGMTFLKPVPIVGSIANVLSTALKEIEMPLKAIKNTLKDVKTNLDKVDKVVKTSEDVTNKIVDTNNSLALFLPKAAKTITVLNYVLQIIDCVLPVVSGKDLQKKVDELKSKIADIEGKTQSVVTSIDGTFKEMEATLNSIETACQNVSEHMEGLRKISDVFTNVGHVLEPIGNAINKIIDVITPLRWLLNATKCLVKKILEPAINFILQKTGIQSLINSLIEKVEKALHIKDVKDALEKIVGDIVNGALMSGLKDFCTYPQRVLDAQNLLNKALGDFSPINNQLLAEKLKGCVTELFNVVIDPTAPAVIPDWPEEITVNSTPVLHIRRNVQRAKKFDWDSLYSRYSNDTLTVTCAAVRGKVIEAEEPTDVYPICADIAKKANGIEKGWNQLDTLIKTLCNNVGILMGTTDLPAYFNAEINSFGVYLNFNVELIKFVSDLSLAKKWEKNLGEINAWLVDQSGDCTEILKTVVAIQASVSELQKHNLQISALISTEEVERMLCSVQSYSTGLHNLLACFELADDHNPSEENKKKLEEQRNKILENAQTLLKDMDVMKESLATTIKLYEQANNEIDSILCVYKRISPDGYILPDKMVDRLVHVSKILAQIQGVFEPLEAIVSVLRKDKAVEASVSGGYSPLKSAQKLIQNIEGSVSTQVAGINLEQLLYDLAPISILKNSLVDFATKKLVVDEGLYTSLFAQTTKIKELISKGCTYRIDDQEIVNKFVGEDDVTKLTELSVSVLNHE
jgi:hypothetical protein